MAKEKSYDNYLTKISCQILTWFYVDKFMLLCADH